MSTTQMKSVIAKELERINDRIDMKIIKGRSYVSEARRHKVLLMRMRELDYARERATRSRSFFAFGR